MSGVDGSFLDREALQESYHLTLDDFIIDLAWSPDGSRLAAVTVEGGVFLIDLERDATNPEFIGQHDGGGNSISWSWDGVEFATAGHDGVAKVWDGHSGREIACVQAGDSWVGKVVYHPRKRVLASVAGKHLRLWSEERALLYANLKHYFIIKFPQRPGALREFVVDILGPNDDITHFEYTKTNSTVLKNEENFSKL